MADEPLTLWTIGHSTRPVAELIDLLGQVPIDLLVDVRSVPRSRTNPQFNFDALPATLAGSGVGYRHLPELGGLRGRRKDGLPSPNTLWRNEAFRNYADYAATSPAFRQGLDELTALARDHRAAIMCAEAVWWRCHRRIVTDYLLVSGVAVAHILGLNKIEAATLTPGACPLSGGTILYPAPAEAQLSLL
ncbi:MAG TPA: DUF488 domain-containing protein [Stellaceae bacterium]|jgi:uncharacterized protein (DUF488 family)|nr:DUF488 domain-containing protein [Stellaceae bacterium]